MVLGNPRFLKWSIAAKGVLAHRLRIAGLKGLVPIHENQGLMGNRPAGQSCGHYECTGGGGTAEKAPALALRVQVRILRLQSLLTPSFGVMLEMTMHLGSKEPRTVP